MQRLTGLVPAAGLGLLVVCALLLYAPGLIDQLLPAGLALGGFVFIGAFQGERRC